MKYALLIHERQEDFDLRTDPVSGSALGGVRTGLSGSAHRGQRTFLRRKPSGL